MRFFLSILSFLLILTSFGQEEANKFKFGFSTYTNISNGFAKKGDLGAEKYEGIASTRFSYSAGLKVTYQFTKKFGISSGINYMNTGDRSLKYQPEPMRGFFSKRFYKHQTEYLEFPINLSRTIGESFQIIIGGSYLFKLKNQFELHIEDGEGYKLDISNFERTFSGATINLGFGYTIPLGKNSLEFIPYAQYNFIHPLNEFYFIDFVPVRKYGSAGIQINLLF